MTCNFKGDFSNLTEEKMKEEKFVNMGLIEEIGKYEIFTVKEESEREEEETSVGNSATVSGYKIWKSGSRGKMALSSGRVKTLKKGRKLDSSSLENFRQSLSQEKFKTAGAGERKSYENVKVVDFETVVQEEIDEKQKRVEEKVEKKSYWGESFWMLEKSDEDTDEEKLQFQEPEDENDKNFLNTEDEPKIKVDLFKFVELTHKAPKSSEYSPVFRRKNRNPIVLQNDRYSNFKTSELSQDSSNSKATKISRKSAEIRKKKLSPFLKGQSFWRAKHSRNKQDQKDLISTSCPHQIAPNEALKSFLQDEEPNPQGVNKSLEILRKKKNKEKIEFAHFSRNSYENTSKSLHTPILKQSQKISRRLEDEQYIN